MRATTIARNYAEALFELGERSGNTDRYAELLDALAAGTPVVTTTYGNEGIGGTPGRDLLVADDPQAFAAAVVAILRDQALAERLAVNGRAFVSEKFSLAAGLAKIERVYGELRGREL